jgi:hypothetical protein
MNSVVRSRLRFLVVSLGCLLPIVPADGQLQPEYLHCEIAQTLVPFRLVTADFNEDDSPDFALIEPGATNADIVLTSRSGFRAGACNSATLSSGGISQNVEFRDLDVVDLGDDGDMDIVVAVELGAGALINMGNASGNFGGTNPSRIDLEGRNPISIAAADFDLDSEPDVALGTADGEVVVLYGLEESGLSERPRQLAQLQIRVDDLTVADLNNDASPDLLVTSRNPPAFQVLLRDEVNPRAFRILASQALDGEPSEIAIAQFDAGSVKDLAITFSDLDQLRVFFGTLMANEVDPSQSDVTFSPRFPAVTTGSDPSAVAAGLLDGDLYVDAAVANESDGTVRIFLNSAGDGDLGEAGGLCTGGCPVGDGPMTLVLATLDPDTLADIAIGGESTLSFLFSSNPPSTPTGTPADTPTRTPSVTRTVTGPPTPTPTETPTASPTPTASRTITATHTFTTVPTKTCPPDSSICVQGESCSVTTGTDGASSSPLSPLLIAGLLAVLRWRSKRWGATSGRA